MTKPENNMDHTDPAAQAVQEEEESKAEPKLMAYTHKFEEPFRWNGKDYEELVFNFAGLTGADSLAAHQEVTAQGVTLVTDAFCLPYLCALSARACTERDSRGFAPIDSEALAAMPLLEFRCITGRARRFLLQSVH